MSHHKAWQALTGTNGFVMLLVLLSDQNKQVHRMDEIVTNGDIEKCFMDH